MNFLLSQGGNGNAIAPLRLHCSAIQHRPLAMPLAFTDAFILAVYGSVLP